MRSNNPRIVSIQQEKQSTRINPHTGLINEQHTTTIIRPEYYLKVQEAYRRYMILYGYDEERQIEYDEEEEVLEHMVETLLSRLTSSGYQTRNPLERVLIKDLETYWNLYQNDTLGE